VQSGKPVEVRGTTRVDQTAAAAAMHTALADMRLPGVRATVVQVGPHPSPALSLVVVLASSSAWLVPLTLRCVVVLASSSAWLVPLTLRCVVVLASSAWLVPLTLRCVVVLASSSAWLVPLTLLVFFAAGP
jgi:hypothetical protein